MYLVRRQKVCWKEYGVGTVVDETRKSKTGRKKSRKLTYFYLNGNLHRSLHISRPSDTIMTWSYPEHKRVGYSYSDVRKNMEKAWTTTEVCKLVNRTKARVETAILEGHIEAPQFTYGLNEHKRMYKYMWNEANIMDLHGYLCTVHRGRPRKDGRVTIVGMPTARELRAMIRQQPVMGYLDQDGNFRPTWLAEDL